MAGDERAGLIFVSYRREDSADITGRIFDRLRDTFGGRGLFRDVDSMPLGVDFREHIRDAVTQCHVVLAVIGPQWAGPKDGTARIEEETDFVRIEIQSALERQIPVIPVLVHGTAMPHPERLPEVIRSLAFLNATSIRSDPDFHRDVDRLITALVQTLPAGVAKRAVRRKRRSPRGGGEVPPLQAELLPTAAVEGSEPASPVDGGRTELAAPPPVGEQTETAAAPPVEPAVELATEPPPAVLSSSEPRSGSAGATSRPVSPMPQSPLGGDEGDEWVMDGGMEEKRRAGARPWSATARAPETEEAGDQRSRARAWFLRGVAVAVAVVAAAAFWKPTWVERPEPGTPKPLVAEPATPPVSKPAPKPVGGLAAMPALALGMTRASVHTLVGPPRPESMIPENGKKPTYGHAIDMYSLSDPSGGAPVSLGLIYAYEYAAAPTSPGQAFEDTAMQVEWTMTTWPGTDVLLAKVDEMQGPADDRLGAKLQPSDLTALSTRAKSCVNVHTNKHAARLLWKSANQYLYVGVWNTALHPQDDACR